MVRENRYVKDMEIVTPLQPTKGDKNISPYGHL
jgi:hypothetical protein